MSDDPFNLAEHIKKTFTYRATSPVHWTMHAQLLFRAARVLFERQASAWVEVSGRRRPGGYEHGWADIEIELFRPALLLAGLAIELLLKGGGLKKGLDVEDLIRQSHGLRSLASTVGIELSDSEHELLDLMQRAILWSGRYPVPRRVENFDVGRIEDFAGTHVADLSNRINNLYEKLRLLVRAM